ncbi:GNAT family N-acetyltransferase [Enterococcus sp. S86.2]|uniref:GNAT family N-acetyltransferase n=1 Tax=Enterococcus sp. S86.2 TaxID=3031299 RepID=UPI0026EC5C04|nr:GNAT family N-acetyltransferase [Enterococcus sp. S86.2]
MKYDQTTEYWDEIVKIRNQIFLNEQGLKDFEVCDRQDSVAIHFIVLLENVLIGCCRGKKINSKTMQIERVCISPNFRKKGFGKELIKFSMKYFHLKGINKVILCSQLDKKIFYENLGFQEIGNVLQYYGKEHVLMEIYQ